MAKLVSHIYEFKVNQPRNDLAFRDETQQRKTNSWNSQL